MTLDAPLHRVPLRNAWRTDYLKDRYLEHLPVDALRQRQKDVFQNVYSFDPNGEMTV